MVKYHGNYCGPYWSAGKQQYSVDSDYPAVDSFDQLCKQHDAAYANGEDLRSADLSFAANAIGTGIKPSLAAIAVGAQGYFRSVDKQSTKTNNNNMTKMNNNQTNKKNLRWEDSMELTKRDMRSPRPNRRQATQQLVAAPVSFARRVSMKQPTWKSSRNGDTCIKHKEYVGTITGSSSFTATSYPCNPGLTNMFPWLNSVASNYDKYKFINLRYIYVPAVASSTAGRITLAFNYNAGDGIPTSKQSDRKSVV